MTSWTSHDFFTFAPYPDLTVHVSQGNELSGNIKAFMVENGVAKQEAQWELHFFHQKVLQN